MAEEKFYYIKETTLKEIAHAIRIQLSDCLEVEDEEEKEAIVDKLFSVAEIPAKLQELVELGRLETFEEVVLRTFEQDGLYDMEGDLIAAQEKNLPQYENTVRFVYNDGNLHPQDISDCYVGDYGEPISIYNTFASYLILDRDNNEEFFL